MRGAAVIVGVLEADEVFSGGQDLSDLGICCRVMIVVDGDDVAAVVKQRQETVKTRTMTSCEHVDCDALRIRDYEGEYVHVAIALNLAIDSLRDLNLLSLQKSIVRFSLSDQSMDAADQQPVGLAFSRR